MPLHDGNSWYYACYDASGKSVGSGEAQATGEAGTYALVLTLPASFGTYEELDLSEASFGVAISGFQAFTFGSTFQYVGYLPSDGGYISSEWPDGNGGTISHTGGGSTSQIVLPMGQTVNAVTFHDVDSKTGPINDISYAPGVGPVLISASGPVINLAADSCILKSYILF
ncbi:MAG TPA: hypothetical protein VIO32_01310 [Candidatus Baltobacteraceae bacterium]